MPIALAKDKALVRYGDLVQPTPLGGDIQVCWITPNFEANGISPADVREPGVPADCWCI